jgi:hypothetical protein
MELSTRQVRRNAQQLLADMRESWMSIRAGLDLKSREGGQDR